MVSYKKTNRTFLCVYFVFYPLRSVERRKNMNRLGFACVLLTLHRFYIRNNFVFFLIDFILKFLFLLYFDFVTQAVVTDIYDDGVMVAFENE